MILVKTHFNICPCAGCNRVRKLSELPNMLALGMDNPPVASFIEADTSHPRFVV